MKNCFHILCSFIFLFISCTKENSTCPGFDEKVEVQFDLITGFNDEVSIKIDEKYYFTAIITGIEYLAGPQATFTTYLSRNEHDLYIYKREFDSIFRSPQIDSTKIVIGSSEKYCIGLSVYPDTMLIIVQDSSFFYI